MRVSAFAWKCEYPDCGHKWLATDIVSPEKCSKCKRRGWHRKIVPPINDSRGHNIPDYPMGIPCEDARFAEGVSVRVVPKVALEDRKAIALQAMRDALMADYPAPVEARLEAQIPLHGADSIETRAVCKYKEYDSDTGQTMACGLAPHAGKVRHGNWRKVD